MSPMLLWNSLRTMLVILILATPAPLTAGAPSPPQGEARPSIVGSPGAVTAALEDAASSLKQSIATIRSRTVEARQAFVIAQQSLEDLKTETAGVRALMALQQFPMDRVEAVHAAYASRTLKLAASHKQLMDELTRLKAGTAGGMQAIAELEGNLADLSVGKEPDEALKALESAFEAYRRLAESEGRELDRFTELSEKTGELLLAEKTLVDAILPLLEKQRDSWKQELLKRREVLSLKQQIGEIWGSVADIPSRVHHGLMTTVQSGAVERFARAHPVLLSGLLALIVLLSWSARGLRRVMTRKLDSWSAMEGRPFLPWVVGVGREAVSQIYPVGLTLWLLLTLKTLGLFETVEARLALFALAILIGMSLCLGLVKVSVEAGLQHGAGLISEGTAHFFRRQLKLAVAWAGLGGLALIGLRLLGFPETIRSLARLIFELGLLYFVIRISRPARVESLLSWSQEFKQTCLRWMTWLGRVRYGLIAVVLIALTAYPLGFQPLSLHLMDSACLSVGLAGAWGLARWAGGATIHFLLHAERGWLGRRFPSRSELLGRLCQVANGSLGLILATGALLGLYTLWGGDPRRLVTVLEWLRVDIPVGSMNLSLSNLLLGCLVLYLGFWLSRLTNRLLQTRVFPRTGWDIGIQYTISTILHYVILILGILMTLNVLGFPLANLALVMGALGVGIGLGLQNIVSNFFSGLVLLIERPIKVGDMLVIDGQWGEVKQIRIRSTVFQTFDKSVVIIPNSEMTASKIVNWTHYGRGSSRITLKLGVAYGTDVALVTGLLKEVCAANRRVLKEPPPQVLFTAYGESSLDFTVMVHVTAPEDRMPATHELNSAIFELFRDHSIEIPFPQRDLHIKNWPRALLGEEA